MLLKHISSAVLRNTMRGICKITSNVKDLLHVLHEVSLLTEIGLEFMDEFQEPIVPQRGCPIVREEFNQVWNVTTLPPAGRFESDDGNVLLKLLLHKCKITRSPRFQYEIALWPREQSNCAATLRAGGSRGPPKDRPKIYFPSSS